MNDVEVHCRVAQRQTECGQTHVMRMGRTGKLVYATATAVDLTGGRDPPPPAPLEIRTERGQKTGALTIKEPVGRESTREERDFMKARTGVAEEEGEFALLTPALSYGEKGEKKGRRR